jgi:hypothetical protein
MVGREDYFKNYYQDNKKKIIGRANKDYKTNRKKRLTSHHKYYKDNREVILAKAKQKSLAFRGHAYSIWSAVKKYAHKWHLPCCTFEEFYDQWTSDDPTYDQLYKDWVDSEYNEYLSPVVMRSVKKNGYVPENLKWDIKKNYSWWNEDSAIFKEVSNRIEGQQKERNQRNKEWRKKVREQWKAKQKEKNK